MTYQQARDDHEYLWSTYGPANDMTGMYVDQDDLAALLKSPSRFTAMTCYSNQIQYWFEVGPEYDCVDLSWHTDVKVKDIAHRHGSEHDLAELRDRFTEQLMG